MKKIIVVIIISTTILGCSLNKKTPYRAVSNYFISYQNLDKKALKNIDRLVDIEKTLTDTQKEKYKNILKKHYKNLKYKIKRVKIINDNAVVLSEIEVNNNIRALEKTINIKDSFIDNNGNLAIERFNDYKIDLLKKEKSKIKYELLFNLHIKNNDWVIDELSLTNQEKLLGMYKNA